ncbi:farnesyl-diphosphate synthase [Lysinibacillus sp. BF-4]|uniref:polyprenyl synthetase family protein n=1 Tax=Lysinibacillus sp. BF-4 TaxID=1473546 RepID=UPI000503701B|nr:farnesyl diphosphate synthase [Lysinibacillus sp. BF-4]KFL43180.1 farnesyl-diphosphate synthase [Lysinibacillus sp. BF-4]
MTLKAFMDEQIPLLEQEMYSQVTRLTMPENLKESMLYSLKAGGKRIRPLFVLAVLDLFNKPLQAGYEVGAALEMTHTYSLIHDDLPSMDDDDLRRGKPTNHIVFGEAIAVLAGDALNTLSLGILANVTGITAEKKVELVQLFSRASGAEGMVGGQVLDIEGEQKQLTLTELEQVHINKTGALLRFGIESGAVLADATPEERAYLNEYAHHIGLAFQIKDDILDIEGTSEELGKTAGKDEASEKSTYPALLTIEGAHKKLQEHYDLALAALNKVDNEATLLQEIAHYIVHRNK